MQIERKHVYGFVCGAIAALSFSYMPTIKAQSSSSLSGQYGCIVNKNFAGYDVTLTGANNVGYNYMFYLDFSNNRAQMAVHLVSGYNSANPSTATRSVTSGTVVVVSGDLTNSHKVSVNLSAGGQTSTVTLNTMSVNSGNTLLVSSGTGGNTDGTPFGGVCSKI